MSVDFFMTCIFSNNFDVIENRQWNRIKMSRANPGEVAYHSAIVVLDSMFLYGGEQGNGQNTNQLWRFRFGNKPFHLDLIF